MLQVQHTLNRSEEPAESAWLDFEPYGRIRSRFSALSLREDL